jgi:6-phosphogluconolactonase
LQQQAFIMRKYVLALLLSIPVLANAQQTYYMLVGTYTSGKSEGIYVYRFENDGTASLVSSVKTANPSYLAVSPNNQYVYAVNENADTIPNANGGGITAFEFDKNKGVLTPVNQQPSAGNHPCYISIDKTGKWLAVGNYSSGTVSILPIEKNGVAGAPAQVIRHNGSGPNTARQNSAHVHASVFSGDGRRLYVPDLGIDKVMQYNFDAATGQISPAAQPFVSALPGSGPRHIEFNKRNSYGYLMEELTGTVTVLKNSNNSLTAIQTISSHPDGYTGKLGSADIHISPDGKFLYCSNRGESNTIAIFAIEGATGKLKLLGHQSTMGLVPRNFNFDPSGDFLLVANQKSDNIVVFKRDKTTGLLTDTGKRIEVPNPVCIKWIRGGMFSPMIGSEPE